MRPQDPKCYTAWELALDSSTKLTLHFTWRMKKKVLPVMTTVYRGVDQEQTLWKFRVAWSIRHCFGRRLSFFFWGGRNGNRRPRGGSPVYLPCHHMEAQTFV